MHDTSSPSRRPPVRSPTRSRSWARAWSIARAASRASRASLVVLAMFAVAALLCGGCPGSQPAQIPPAPTMPAPEATGSDTGDAPHAVAGECPTRPTIRVASHRLVPGEEAAGGDGVEAFFLHERILSDAEDDLALPKFRDQSVMFQLTAETAGSHGVDTSDAPVWLFRVDRPDPPCKAKPAEFWVAREGDGALYTAILRRLEGDCALADEGRHYRLAIRGGSEVSACRWKPATTSKARTLLDAVDGVTLPKPLATLGERCAAPGCQLRWNVAGEFDHPAVEVRDVIVSRVKVKPGEDECLWQVEDAHRLLVAPPGQATPAVIDLHARYAGLLHDLNGTIRALVMEEPGTVYSYTPPAEDGAAGPVSIGIARWYVAHEEDALVLTAGPDCGL